MKLHILLGSAILFATALTPMNAVADDQNLMCRRNGCDPLSSNEHRSISGVSVSLNTSKSSDRNNRNPGAEAVLRDDDTAAIDNNTNDTAAIDNNTDDAIGADNGTENDTDAVADNNTAPPQHNSNHIKGYDPFTDGLYGPGT
jgi:hypothetical protein